MTTKVGILSDTHLIRPDSSFKRQVKRCFSECEIIIHAGDITDLAVLAVFSNRQLFAVHGNMCNHEVYKKFPEELCFSLDGFTIGLTHGARLGYDIESALHNLFPGADCMIYGHTHRAVCHRHGSTLIINPGSFKGTGPYGAPGTYAILEVGDTLQAQIHEILQIP